MTPAPTGTLSITRTRPGASRPRLGVLRRLVRGAISRSISRRLAAGFGATLMLLVAVVGVGFAALSGLMTAADEVARGTSLQVAAADEVRAASAAVLAAQGQYLIDSGASRPDYDAATVQLTGALHVLAARATQPASQALVERISTGYQTFAALDAMIWDAVQAGDVIKAKNLALGPERLAYSHITTDSRAYSDYARQQERAATVRLHRVATRARWAMLAIGLTAVSVGAWAATTITNSVRRPMAELEAASARAAAGDLTARVDRQHADEAGRLASVFNHMVARLEDFVAEADFDAQLRRALEYVDTEPEVLDVIVEAATSVAPDNPVELLLADSSQAHLEQVAIAGPTEHGPGCPVQLPFSCPAVRNGRPTIYPDSRHLGACPKLKDRPEGPLAAACVPVTFMGRALGVVHLTGPTTAPPTPQLLDRLTTLATEVGNRIGTVRAFERTHVQASTDSLTGLLNRRALEAAVRDLRRAGHQYAVILADLDHFKKLNDTHGHEAGDRALRLFARVIRDTTRPGDLISRYGGEEFVVALPHCTAEHAHDLAQRIQTTLTTATATATVPPFSFSAGVADSTMGTDLTTVLRHADTALYRAKDNGRNQVHAAIQADTADGDHALDTSATTPTATDSVHPTVAPALPRRSPPTQHESHSEALTPAPQPAAEGMFANMNQPEPMLDA